MVTSVKSARKAPKHEKKFKDHFQGSQLFNANTLKPYQYLKGKDHKCKVSMNNTTKISLKTTQGIILTNGILVMH